MNTYTHAAMLAELTGIADRARHVFLDREQLSRVADVMRRRHHVDDFQVRRDSPDLTPADLLQFYMVAGVHNFLIWQRDLSGQVVPWTVHVNGERRYGAPAVYACHVRALQRGRNILDPDYLTSMTLAAMEDYYRDEETGRVTLQFIPQRLAKFHEIGKVLKEKHNRSFLTLLERAEGYLFRDDGQGIAQQLLTHFPLSYRDWPFCKLVMVTVGNLYQDRDRLFPTASRYRDLINLHDPERLEVGADYYRPFFLYRVGVLRISTVLREHLVKRELLDREGPIEREYRAWTILGTRELARRLGVIPHDLARETWAMGFMRCRPCRIGVSEEEVPCSYRPICHSYNEETVLMQALWPLVLTTSY